MTASHTVCPGVRHSSPAGRLRSVGAANAVVSTGCPAARVGAAAVEFAVVAPLLILMIFAMLELGRGLMVQQVLTTASIVGARRAAVVAASHESVTETILDYTASLTVHGVTVEVDPLPSATRLGEPISVTVAVDFAKVSWRPAPWFLRGKSLNATTVMRKEGFPDLTR